MKRHFHHPEPVKTDRRYWRSLSEYDQTPEFKASVGREFDPGLSVMGEEEQDNTRRNFMKIMGGAAAVSGLSMVSCRRPLQKILPFTRHVEWLIPGKPLLYATTMPRAGGATPVVVTTYEGRPTHLQGNPLHPSGAGLDIFAQASVVDLYNPDRLKTPLFSSQVGKGSGSERDWNTFQKGYLRKWGESWKKSGGEALAVLINETTSPTQLALLASLKKAMPKSKAFAYEPIHRNGYDAAVKALFGDGVKVLPQLAKADVVFSLDCDFIGLDPQGETSMRDFMKNRAPSKAGEKMNRLYALENRYTLTGGIADHRKPIAASLIPVATAVLAQEIGKLANDSILTQAATALTAGAPEDLREWIAEAAKDLSASKGRALVLAGARYDEAVQALVLGINNALGAFGATLETVKVEKSVTGPLDELLADLKAKKVKQLFILTESDPAYDAPGFKEALVASGADIVTLALRENLTTKYSNWALPAAHYLEAWGDARCSDGCYAVVQPMIAPLFDGASINDVLLAIQSVKNLDPSHYSRAFAAALEKDPKAQAESDPSFDVVKESFGKAAGGWSADKWNVTLRDGFLADSVYPKAGASFNAGAIAGLVSKAQPAKAVSATSMEIVLTPDASLWDGRYVDNSWLQEAPDPITKQAWDNAAWINPTTFKSLGLKKDGDMVKVTVGGKSLELAAIACPGHAQNSITIPLGYGQEITSEVGRKTGFDSYQLRTSANEFILTGVEAKATGGKYELAITQDNYVMEGRAQVREATAERFNKDEKFAKHEGMDSHVPPNISLYQGRIGSNDPKRADFNEEGNGFDYKNEHQWGMVIDLSKCIGCSACIVACQSENNIPIVGKDQVVRGRVLHWIRMDRYFATSGGVEEDQGGVNLAELDNPEMVNQPVACQQCESAPCETVCPVNATIHTEEGLNAMAYNRCIGTRYCANNCPYTARRFNWFDYNKRNPLVETKLPLVGGIVGENRNLYAGPFGEKKPQEVAQLQKNPNVTVRMRGVIEKCTYCVQRLESAKINQRRVARDDASKLRIPTDGVKTACQASCPAEAIMFGDLANEKSTVNRWKENPRDYQVLSYIGTRPRTSYLARIRNVNPLMAQYETGRKVPTGGASSQPNSF